MTMPQVRLVYWSTARPGLDEVELQRILAVSRVRNPRHHLTGVLLFQRGRFVQALEGERDHVVDLYTRVVNDPRHRGCVLLGVEPIAERAFGHWSMGRLPVHGADSVTVDDWLVQLRERSPLASHPAATAMLVALARHLQPLRPG